PLAIPVGADAIELLTHPPARQVRVFIPWFGEQDGSLAFRLAHCGQGEFRLAEPGFLGLLAAKEDDVLAGALVGVFGLVPPGGTLAGVAPPDVLDLPGPASPFHFSRSAIR